MKKLSLSLSVNIILEKDGGGYYAHCPSFKGLHVYGNTKAEAVKFAKDAIVGYSISLLKHKDPLPCDAIIKEAAYNKLKRSHAIFPEKVNIPLEEPLALAY